MFPLSLQVGEQWPEEVKFGKGWVGSIVLQGSRHFRGCDRSIFGSIHGEGNSIKASSCFNNGPVLDKLGESLLWGNTKNISHESLCRVQ